MLPAAFAPWRRGKGVGGAGVSALISKGKVRWADGKILGVKNHFDIVFVQPIRLTPGAPLAPPPPILAPALVLPNIPAFLKLTKRKCRKVRTSTLKVYLFLVFLALVLVGGLAVLLVCALLLALVPVAAAPPPEPELGALLAPLQAIARPLASPPPLGQGPDHQQGQEQQPKIFLTKAWLK